MQSIATDGIWPKAISSAIEEPVIIVVVEEEIQITITVESTS